MQTVAVSSTYTKNIATEAPKLAGRDVLAVARLCRAVYDPAPSVAGFQPLSAKDLGLDEKFADGCKFVNKNACAFVKEGMVDGERTLLVVFKGTDMFSLSDWLDDAFRMDRHYRLMKPLVEAVDSYIKAHGITRVVSAGHSLGGAMAARFMHEHPPGALGAEYVGCTFGSPGSNFNKHGGYEDRRIIEFRHDKDVVPKVGRVPVLGGLLGGYTCPGRIVEINVEDRDQHKGWFAGVAAHAMDDYVKTIAQLRKSNALDAILERVDNVRISYDRWLGSLMPRDDYAQSFTNAKGQQLVGIEALEENVVHQGMEQDGAPWGEGDPMAIMRRYHPALAAAMERRARNAAPEPEDLPEPAAAVGR